MIRQVGLAACVLSMVMGTPVFAQESGDHGTGGSSGCGDLFGDLVQVLRERVSGQPILQLRFVGYPADFLGLAFCPIAVDAAGNEIGFFEGSEDELPSCEAADATKVVEVDYFGRLSAGRTKERNVRMHFDETISSINAAKAVDRDPAGRLKLLECTDPEDAATCTWRVIDSPQENLALYQRVMKYGHIQTNAEEVDADAHGDPALGIQYHPVLADGDHAKFSPAVLALLPTRTDLGCLVPPSEVGGATRCDPEPLTGDDLVLATGFLGGAADKHGRITVDLVQYLNRILKITTATPMSAAALDTLPAKVRVCDANATPGALSEGQLLPCGLYDADSTDITSVLVLMAARDVRVLIPPPDVEGSEGADDNLKAVHAEADAQIKAAQEKSVDYGEAAYDRNRWFNVIIPAIMPAGVSFVTTNVPLLPYLEFKNPGGASGSDVGGFVNAASDAVRTVEFIHNYEVPEDLGWTLPTSVSTKVKR
jgi:hypothetical protein